MKDVDPVMRITHYIMPMRCDAQVFLEHSFDMSPLSDYLRRLRREKHERITYMQLLVAAYVRSISRNPQVNRFVMNK